MYLALFSRFTTCGSWEGRNILDFMGYGTSETVPSVATRKSGKSRRTL